MSGDIVLSKLGVSFTIESALALRRYAESADKDDSLLYLHGRLDKHGILNVNFVGDHVLRPAAIRDQLEDSVFYWLINQSTFELIRKSYCVDAEWGRETRVILLATAQHK